MTSCETDSFPEGRAAHWNRYSPDRAPLSQSLPKAGLKHSVLSIMVGTQVAEKRLKPTYGLCPHSKTVQR